MGHILVCDDADDVRMVVALALEMAGHTVLQAGGGQAAVDALDAHPELELLVLDVQMPDVDGWEVLAVVRGHPSQHGLRVLMCTVKSDLRDLLRAWELGCDGYIVKPFDLTCLTDEVHGALQRSDADRRALRADRVRQLRLLRDSTRR